MREVVGVAILEGGRVLAARRSHPPALAGQWELPGGKVEPGEDPAAAAVREIAEELACEIEPGDWLAGESVIPGDSLVLRVVTARLVGRDPVPVEHDAVRWLAAADLGEVSWAAADVPFLTPLAEILGAG